MTDYEPNKDSRISIENFPNSIIGIYQGYAKYVEGNNSLGSSADGWVDYLLVAEVDALLTWARNNELNILIRFRCLNDFEFRNNAIHKDEYSHRILIEGDWLTGLGIIGWIEESEKKLIIDVNPFSYTQAQNSGKREEDLVNRHVILDKQVPFSYKTVFNLEFEGVKR